MMVYTSAQQNQVGLLLHDLRERGPLRGQQEQRMKYHIHLLQYLLIERVGKSQVSRISFIFWLHLLASRDY